MTHTTTHRAASDARSPAALSVHIVEELHCYVAGRRRYQRDRALARA